MLGVEIDPDAKAADLALGHQQQVEIIKALWRGSRVLILDEPTSMLTPQALPSSSEVLGRLKEQGQAVVFITHKLHEALSLGDRISILRQGRLVGTIDRRGALRSKAARGASRRDRPDHVRRGGDGRRRRGRAAATSSPDARGANAASSRERRRSRAARRERSGRGRGARHRGRVAPRWPEGEILGVAGVDGNGQRALAEVVAGQRRASPGDVLLYGAPVTRLSGLRAPEARPALRDRRPPGRGNRQLAPGRPEPVPEAHRRSGRSGGTGASSGRSIDRAGRRARREFDVRTPSVATRAGTLSGGNIQKVMLARELSLRPEGRRLPQADVRPRREDDATVRDLIREPRRTAAARRS